MPRIQNPVHVSSVRAKDLRPRFAQPSASPRLSVCIRNVSSTARDGYEDARAMGSDIQSVRQFRALGVDGMLARIPEGSRYYVTIDIDGFDPSVAPGTGTPSHGGFLYYEVLELLDGLTKRGSVVGVDLVEVAPDYDPTGSTTTLAAQILLNLIGRIAANR